MFTVSWDEAGGQPLYQQLYHYIREQIESGKLTGGQLLPAKRRLAEYLGISLNTVRAAYEQLMQEGYVEGRERVGYFVNSIDPPFHEGSMAPALPVLEVPVPEVQYDFSFQGVDPATFPYTLFRKLAKEVIDEYDQDFGRHCEPKGYLPLRQAIQQYLLGSRGVACTPEQIVISSGTEYLFQILFQLLGEGWVYGVENPGYLRLAYLFAGNRMPCRPVSLDSQGVSPEAVLREKPDVLCITPSHQFPTGIIMPVNRRRQLLEWCRQNPRRYIVEDDYDSEFKYGGRPIPALKAMAGSEQVIYMGSFSKSLSPALRLSYMVLPDSLNRAYSSSLPFFVSSVPLLEQKLMGRFMQDGHFQRHVNKLRTLYKRKREKIMDFFAAGRYPIALSGADAGLHILLQADTQRTEAALVATAARSGIRVHGLSEYCSDQAVLPRRPQVLLGYASMPEEKLEEALQCLMTSWFGSSRKKKEEGRL